MKTIKLIDIWERIARGEKPPKKILLMGTILTYDEDLKTYIDEIEREPIDRIFNLWVIFKDEVEIIEDKTIKRKKHNKYMQFLDTLNKKIDEADKLEERIDKAIEYIENDMPYLEEPDEEFERSDGTTYMTMKEYDTSILLKILKGEENESN